VATAADADLDAVDRPRPAVSRIARWSYATAVTDSATVPDLIDHALAAYADLTELGEDVEDEWSYVNDLSASWTDRLERIGADRAGEEATAAQVAAVDQAVAEIAAISDPHRAIDWLSTFPQVVLVALGEQP
jgi:hypothetical protein